MEYILSRCLLSFMYNRSWVALIVSAILVFLQPEIRVELNFQSLAIIVTWLSVTKKFFLSKFNFYLTKQKYSRYL